MRSRRLLDTPPKRPRSTPPPVRPPHALRRRLGADTIQELIAAYRNGSTSPELMVRYQISKGALLGILHEEGLAVRKMGLTPVETETARRLRTDDGNCDGIAGCAHGA